MRSLSRPLTGARFLSRVTPAGTCRCGPNKLSEQEEHPILESPRTKKKPPADRHRGRLTWTHHTHLRRHSTRSRLRLTNSKGLRQNNRDFPVKVFLPFHSPPEPLRKINDPINLKFYLLTCQLSHPLPDSLRLLKQSGQALNTVSLPSSTAPRQKLQAM